MSDNATTYAPTGSLKSIQIPDGWDFKRFDHVATRIDETGKPELPPLSVFLDQGVVPREDREDNHNQLGADLSKYLVVKPGDIVFNKLRTWQGGIGVSSYEGIVSPAYYIVRPDSTLDSHYGHHLLRSEVYLSELKRRSKWMPPSQFDIPWDQLRTLPFLLPPLNEQKIIAAYLDHATAQLDDLIAQKQRLIDLLKEKRQALITQAVTKGLNPKAKMKDSGVEWLGQIPEHWDVKRLGFVCKLNPGKSEIKDYPSDTAISFIPMESIGENGNLVLDEIRNFENVYQGFTYFRDGDVIVAKITPCFENGKGALCVGLRNGIGMGTTELHVLRPEVIEGKYLYWITRLWAFRIYGATGMRGSAGQQRVPIEFIKNWLVGLPPRNEQADISNRVECVAVKIDEIIDMNQKAIELLIEKRASLISAAVTGKIDLRNWKSA